MNEETSRFLHGPGLFDRDRIDELSATPGVTLDAAVELALASVRADWVAFIVRAVASEDSLERLISEREPDEFTACLVQEFVMQHGSAKREPFLSALRALTKAGHPFAWLPLERSGLESTIMLPAVGSEPSRVAQRDRGRPTVSLGRPDEVGSIDEETTAELDVEAIGAAFQSWVAHSNGHVEVRRFSLGSDVTAPIERVLAMAELVSLAGAKTTGADEIDPSVGVRRLFEAAIGGGAYGRLQGAGYGRLRAWQSVAGLLDLPATVGFEVVDREAREARWFEFDADTEWFHGVAWDVGPALVPQAGDRIAIVAASDTD